MKQRNLQIDLVKIIAMFMIMTMHLTMFRTSNIVALCLHFASGIAMPLFFMVSGYLMWNRDVNYKYSLYKTYKILRFILLFTILYCLFNDKGFHNLLNLLGGAIISNDRLFMFWYLYAMIIIYLLLPFIQYLDKQFKFFHIIFLAFLFIGVSNVFVLNETQSFEYHHSIQTFRLWNWCFYFTLGGYIAKHSDTLNKMSAKLPIKLMMYISFIVSLLLYIAFLYYMQPYLYGIEYFFGSNLCMVYSLLLFLTCISFTITENQSISILSKCFLPAYAIHMNVIVFVDSLTMDFGIITPVIEIFAIIVITVTISTVIMHIPYLNKIFHL